MIGLGFGVDLALGLGLEPMPVVMAAPTLAIRREKRSIKQLRGSTRATGKPARD